MEQPSAPEDPARELLKQATTLKREKRYDDAIAVLRRAYAAPSPSHMMIEELLRLPMYLQLAGRAGEGWQEIDRLESVATDGFSQARIAAQRAVFLRKAGQPIKALPYSALAICLQRVCDDATLASMIALADEQPERDREWEKSGLPPWPQSLPQVGRTAKGNPIYAVGYPVIKSRLDNGYTANAIVGELGRDLVKVAGDKAPLVAQDLADYIARCGPYLVEDVRAICARHVDAGASA